MARANQAMYRKFYRDVFTPALAPFRFARVGQQNVWRKDTSGGLVHLIGAAAGWLGGSRELEWDIFVPDLDHLMRGDGPRLPFGGRVALGYCHVSGRAAHFIRPGVLADHPELTADFELVQEQTTEERHQLEGRVHSTLQLFANRLESFETLEDILRLLTVTDPAGDRRFMPNKALTPWYAVGIAILAKSPDLPRLVAQLRTAQEESRVQRRGGSNPVWDPVANRLLEIAKSIAD
jgi:hypothetical protein